MAQYNLAIPSFRIHQIRSLLNDTLSAATSLRVLNAQGALHHDWGALSVDLGDHKPTTTVQTNLLYENVDVPDPTPDLPKGGSIEWGFLLTNKAHPGQAFLSELSKAADAFAGAVAGSLITGDDNIIADIAIVLGILAGQELLNLAFADCDGVVGTFGVNLTAAQLSQMTADPANWLNGVNCPGTDSPDGCGSNSSYTIYYSIINTNSLVTVPDLIGKSPANARDVAQQAGFGFMPAASYTGPKNQPPVVDSQIPSAGSHVPPGGSIEVIVIYPSRTGIEF